MKHHIALLLALVLALSLAACGNTPAETTTPPETTLAPDLPPETTLSSDVIPSSSSLESTFTIACVDGGDTTYETSLQDSQVLSSILYQHDDTELEAFPESLAWYTLFFQDDLFQLNENCTEICARIDGKLYCTKVSQEIGTTIQEILRNTILAQIPSGYVSLADLVEGTTISLEVSGDTALLTQDGLTLTLTSESKLVCRNGYVMGVQKKYTKLIDGQAYVYDGFAADFLPDDATGQASLFVNARFFPQEILQAVEDPSGSDFNLRVVMEILLDPSMGIQIPHVDMDRAFSLTPLEEYSPELLQELGDLGYDTTRSYTYGEYLTLSYAQTLAQANLSDDTQTTLEEYYAQLAQKDFQTFLEGLTEEERAFAQTYDITDQDLNFLLREFGDTLLTQTEETIRSALENYYQADLDYLAE